MQAQLIVIIVDAEMSPSPLLFSFSSLCLLADDGLN